VYPLYKDGRLDSQSEALLRDLSKVASKPLTAMTVEEARSNFIDQAWLGDPLDILRLETLEIEGPGGPVPLRVYVPRAKLPCPILLFFHGGGFVLGRAPEFDAYCTRLACCASCIVVSVDYRLAPEHKYPAAVHDCLAAVDWVCAHALQFGGDPRRMAVAGDSAGGNLAAVVSRLVRDQKPAKLIHQVLICPWVDLSSTDSESFRYFGEGPWLSRANIEWYRRHYLDHVDQATDPLVSPLLAARSDGLPPATVITAEFDVLRDQGELYARRLQEAGCVVRCRRYTGALHDFVILPGLFDLAKEATDDICRDLRTAFAGAPTGLES
jgi:acetyl esterase